MRSLYLIRGVPGSGKSTLASRLFNPFEIFEADQYWEDKEWDSSLLHEAHEDCYNRLRKEMMIEVEQDYLHSDLCVCNTFTQEKDLKRYFELAEEFGYQVFSIIVENRNDTKSIHGVPEITLTKMESQLKNNIKLK